MNSKKLNFCYVIYKILATIIRSAAMSKALKIYKSLYKKIQSDDITDKERIECEEKIEEIYFDLDDNDLMYIERNELEI